MGKNIWHIIYPLCIYHLILIGVMFAAGMFVGTGTEDYMLCQVIGSLAALPVMYYGFYRGNAALSEQQTKVQFKDMGKSPVRIIMIMLTVSCVSVGFGNLLTMSCLADISRGFAEANEHFYGSTILLEIMGSAILTPVLEELLYRGIIYERLRFFMGNKYRAAIISSLIFAVVHFNIVQFVYALFMGLLLAWCMDMTGHVYGAMLGHMTSNLIAVLRTEYGLWQHIGDGSSFAWAGSAALLLCGMVLLAAAQKWKNSSGRVSGN